MSQLDNLFAGMTVADLAKMSGKSVGEIVAHALAGNVNNVGGTPKARQKKAGARRGGGVVTRTREGREALDGKILSFLKRQSQEVGADAIRAAVGGSPTQIRARLKAIRGVKRKGRARATVYWVR